MCNLKYASLVMVLVMLPSAAQPRVLCFVSTNTTPVIRLQFVRPHDGETTGFIRYEGGSGEIPIFKISEKGISPKEQIPSAVRTIFSERVNGMASGEYVMVSTGGMVGEITYIKRMKRKKFIFYEDGGFSSGNSCDWTLGTKSDE